MLNCRWAAKDSRAYVVVKETNWFIRSFGMDEVRPTSGAQAHGMVPLFPPGLQAIYGECRRLYPDQANPLQVTAIVKYW